jgi:nitrite reductase/ring-hydroxylating ferredoxin subunit
MPKDFVKIANTNDVQPGDKKLIHVGDEPILLVNVRGSYYAVGGECPHAFAYLSYGHLAGDEIECPLHGAAFSVKTGEVLSQPANEDLPVYAVKVDGEDILVGPSPG